MLVKQRTRRFLGLSLGVAMLGAAVLPTATIAQGGGTLTAHLYQQFTSYFPWSESGTGW